MTYSKYLQSKSWLKKREIVFKNRGKICCLCLNKNNLIIHHKSYQGFPFKEKSKKLSVLCRSCHSLWHFYHDGIYLKFKYIRRVVILLNLGASKNEAIRFSTHLGAYRILRYHLEQKIKLNHFGLLESEKVKMIEPRFYQTNRPIYSM